MDYILQGLIVGGARGERWNTLASIRSARASAHHLCDAVVSALEAELVFGHHRCQGLRGLHGDPVDLSEPLAGHLLALGPLQAQLQVVHCPLAPVDVIVVLPVFQNGNVGGVSKQIIQLAGTGGVCDCAEAVNPKLMQVTAQCVVHTHQDIEAVAEFLPLINNGLLIYREIT